MNFSFAALHTQTAYFLPPQLTDNQSINRCDDDTYRVNGEWSSRRRVVDAASISTPQQQQQHYRMVSLDRYNQPTNFPGWKSCGVVQRFTHAWQKWVDGALLAS